MSAAPFFPPRQEREILDFVLTSFPFPLATAYARLQEEMDRQEPVAAALQLRDALECLLRFCASIAAADLLQAGPEPAGAAEVAKILLTPQGLSLGHWHELLVTSLEPLGSLALAGNLLESGRRLPALFGAFYEARGKLKKTPVHLKIRDVPDNFVHWRNRVFGHGAFQDRRFYAEETLRWQSFLVDFCKALRPVLEGWTLVGITPGGERVIWQGYSDAPPPEPHLHEPWGQPLPMFLVRGQGAAEERLPLGPLLSMQECALCHEPAAFFFDRNKLDKERHRTIFLEYFRGHHAERKDWEEARKLAALLPPTFKWERGSYDTEEVAEEVRLVFRDFETEKVRPSYLLDALWQRFDSQPKGYCYLVGPAGTGKTYAVRFLEREGAERGTPVLAYHILPGEATGLTAFMCELYNRAGDQRLRYRTEMLQARGATTPEELQKEFAAFAGELIKANRLNGLVIALDALDELPDREPGTPSILDFLPPAEMLPDNCHILLTSREELRPDARECLDRLQDAGGGLFHVEALQPQSGQSQDVLREYLRRKLPEAFRADEHIAAVVERSGGVFLYAFHFCRALALGVFPNTTHLPAGDHFYPVYLDRLREQASPTLFETVYLPTLLLLSAARSPVSLDQLQRWGVPRQRLSFALLDLSDFLKAHRSPTRRDSLGEDGEARYEIAHDAFVRFARADPVIGPRWREAHARIARQALDTWGGRWREIDPTEEAPLYALRFLFYHLQEAGLSAQEAALWKDEPFGDACVMMSMAAIHRARFHLAVELTDHALAVYRNLLHVEGRKEVEDDLALALGVRANALQEQGRVAEATECYRGSIELLRRLVEEQKVPTPALGAILSDAVAGMLNSGRMADALECSSEVVDIFRKVQDEGNLPRFLLATALANRGAALAGMGRLAEALECVDEALPIFEGQIGVDEDAATGMAQALLSKGAALVQLGRHIEGLRCLDESQALFRDRVRQGQENLAAMQARAAVNRGLALHGLFRFHEASSCLEEAVRQCRRLVDEGRRELALLLGLGLWCRGHTLLQLGRVADSVARLEEAIDLLRQLVDEGQPAAATVLITALMQRGGAEHAMGRWDRALEYLGEAVRTGRRLVLQGWEEIKAPLAQALVTRGEALMRTGGAAEGRACIDEAITIYRRLVRSGREDLVAHLAQAVVSRGTLLLHLEQFAEAVAGLDEGIRTFEPLVEGGRRDVASLLVLGLVNKGVALRALGRFDESVRIEDRAIALSRRLVGEGLEGAAVMLAMATMNKGITLQFQNRLQEAVICYQSVADVFRRAIRQEGRGDMLVDLATLLLQQGVALGSLDRPAEALACFDEVVPIQQQLIAAGRQEFNGPLLMVQASRAALLSAAGRWQDAIACDEQIISMLEPTALARMGASGGEIGESLARTHLHRGDCLESLRDDAGARLSFDEAAAICDLMFYAGFTPLAVLIAALRRRLALLARLRAWDEAAADLRRAFEQVRPFVSGKAAMPEGLGEEFAYLLGHLRTLAEADREQLLAPLGELSSSIRALLAE